MGLAMAGLLFGTPVAPTFAARFMTFGGMGLGLVAAMFLFTVLGALAGTAAGGLVRAALGVRLASAVSAPAKR